MKNTSIPKARREKLVVQNLDKETLVYDLETNRAFCLNPTSTLVWQECNGVNTVDAIVACLSTETKKPVERELVELALSQLSSADLLEKSSSERKKIGDSRLCRALPKKKSL